jgi:hypothetical protein
MKETLLANKVTSILMMKIGHLICPPMVCHCWIRSELGAFDRISTTRVKLKRRSVEGINMLVAAMNTHNTDMLLTGYSRPI